MVKSTIVLLQPSLLPAKAKNPKNYRSSSGNEILAGWVDTKRYQNRMNLQNFAMWASFECKYTNVYLKWNFDF